MTSIDFSPARYMKLGDRVKLVGNKWRTTIRGKQPFYGDIIEVAYYDSDYGEAIFTWTDPITGNTDPWSIDDNEWCGIILPKYDLKDVIEERSVMISSDPDFWDSPAEIALIQKEKEIVESKVRRTYRSWPYNKKIFHEVDRQRQKVIFYWASLNEEMAA